MKIMNKITIRKMEPPMQGGDVLQPLREVGSSEKTRFWDIEEILGALREANSRGIRPESLFARSHGGSDLHDGLPSR